MTTIPNIPLREVLLLWSELEEARLGRNGYGSDTAELYAYRFVGRSPVAENEHLRGGTLHGAAAAEMAHDAADGLAWLCDTFATLRECVVTINELPVSIWRSRIGGSFDHRAHVRVTLEPR